jgi:hypothetical protein
MPAVSFCADGPVAFGELMLPADGLLMPDDGAVPGVALAGAAVEGFIAPDGLVVPCARARLDVARAIVVTTAAAVKNRCIIILQSQ